MSVWKLVANFAIPPALVLTFLLILPLPTVLRRGLLGFTRNVLFFEVAGGFRLAHVMMLLTGAALAGTGFNTYKLSADVSDDRLTPNQRMGVLARKWREERNFWIA
ncbi:Bap31 domain-containing protein, partial [Haematococcus lacustris]